MNLTDQVDFLRVRLIDVIATQFPDPLTQEDQVLSSSFLVLCHASIEEAIEDEFRAYCSQLVTQAASGSGGTPLARFLFAMRTQVEPQGDPDIAAIANMCFAKYEKGFLDMNNGVKSTNVKKLAKAAGVRWTDCESALSAELSDLDTLGVKRGSAGHLSPFTNRPVAITTSTDPSDVVRWVTAGVAAVGALNSYLMTI